MIKERAINAAIPVKKDILEKHAFARKAQTQQLSLVASKHRDGINRSGAEAEKKQDRIKDQVCFGRDICYY